MSTPRLDLASRAVWASRAKNIPSYERSGEPGVACPIFESKSVM